MEKTVMTDIRTTTKAEFLAKARKNVKAKKKQSVKPVKPNTITRLKLENAELRGSLAALHEKYNVDKNSFDKALISNGVLNQKIAQLQKDEVKAVEVLDTAESCCRTLEIDLAKLQGKYDRTLEMLGTEDPNHCDHLWQGTGNYVHCIKCPASQHMNDL
jgi:hypothetical protein